MDAILGPAVHQFVIEGREALGIWAMLTLIGLLSFALLAGTARSEGIGVARSGTAWKRRRAVANASAYVEARRTADEITVAAWRAETTLERRVEAWRVSRKAAESAWSALEAAETRERELLLASRFPVPQGPLTPAEVAERERYLHREVTAAFNRGDLSMEQMLDAQASRNGWNPCLHPTEQEIIIRRLTRQRRMQIYQAASAVERIRWHRADLAAAARRSLADEAFQANLQARQALIQLARVVPQHRRTRGPLLARFTDPSSNPAPVPGPAPRAIGRASVATATSPASASGRATVRLA